MSSGSVRRRRPTAGTFWEGSNLPSLRQPLLDDSEDDSPRKDDRRETSHNRAAAISQRESNVWRDNFVSLVAQWVEWFGHVMKGATSAISNLGGTVLALLQSRPRDQIELPPLVLSAEQERNLRKLQGRIAVPFEGSLEEHQEALRALWKVAYPDKKLSAMISEQWKEMGWQGTDPSTDFRGGGFISLQNLLHFAYRYPVSFRRLLNKENGSRSEWEYPFAVAGLNISFMLLQLFDLRADVPNSLAGRRFVRLLGEDENAFDEIYCVAFEMMDAQWLAMRASYMDFNLVLNTVKAQLEHAMAVSNVKSVNDLPSYQLLVRK